MDTHIPEPSLYSIKAILILDNDSNRILAKDSWMLVASDLTVSKYYDNTFPSAKEQKVFEKNLFNKTHRANAEIIMFEGLTCVYRSSVDLFFYVIGSANENELILVNMLNCFYDSISSMLRKNVEKRTLIENMDGVFLTVDEICDNGIILECDPVVVSQRTAFRSDDLPLGEQTVSSVLQQAKEQLKWSLLK